MKAITKNWVCLTPPFSRLSFFIVIYVVAVDRSLHAEVDITKWLGSKPAGSLLYVSFGSVVRTSNKVIREIAHGLRISEVNFIWVARVHCESFTRWIRGGVQT